jgi:hypothetical protein
MRQEGPSWTVQQNPEFFRAVFRLAALSVQKIDSGFFGLTDKNPAF